MVSDDERTNDDEKNILNSNGSFLITKNQKVSLKFKGTHGRINNITITTSKYNDYIRTSPDFEKVRIIDGSFIRLNMKYIKEFEFDGSVNYIAGDEHNSPIDYFIIKDSNNSFGLYDLDIATNVYYHYYYSEGSFNIINQNGMVVFHTYLEGNYIWLFNNINGKITNFIITDFDNETTNITIENTIKEYIPGVIKSPVIVLDENELPLDLSSSYRYYYKNNKKHYVFTNTEREYFEPAYSLFLDSSPVDVDGSVMVYGIKHNSKWNLDKLLEIENEGFDSLNACADSYDIYFEENLRYINKETGEIRLENIEDYKYIVVDYLKDNSYCLNYRYELNSYEVDISVKPETKISMIYDNIGYTINDLRFINESRYVNTNMIPLLNGYVTIGGGNH
jgi:hypothetical protein